jgi:hypothetical protein
MKAELGGHVYFLVMKDPRGPEDSLDLVKIGITSKDVVERVAALQTGNPYDLRCFDFFHTRWPTEVEHFMHRRHAPDMKQNEWLRWRLGDLHSLVNEAKEAARRIEEHKSKEQEYSNQASNGQVRQAAPEEVRLRADAQQLLKERMPAQLRLSLAENRLKAATGATLGIPGIVRVIAMPEARRFSVKLARSQCPELCVPEIRGTFLWRRKPQRHCFSAEFAAARAAKKEARAATERVLGSKVGLQGWTDRTPDLERWHGDFLQETRIVHQLDAKLADLQTELTLRLREYDAIEGVCGFQRRSVPKIDRSAVLENCREKYDRCLEQCAPQLRKHVYTARSYL